MMIAIPPDYAVAQMIGTIKGKSAISRTGSPASRRLIASRCWRAASFGLLPTLTTHASLAAGVIHILRDMLDPLRRLAQRNRDLLGPVRGGS